MLDRLPRWTVLFAASAALISCTSDESLTQPRIEEEGSLLASVPASNSWTTKARMPTSRHSLTLGVANNSSGQAVVYAFGGIDPTSDFGDPVDQVEAYNTATNSWSTRGRMPEALFRSNGVGRIRGKLYLPGGGKDIGDGFEISPHLWVYDPAADTWTRKADLPKLVSDGITGVIDGKLYILTGRCDNCNNRITRRLYRYDPTTNKWDTALPSCPQAHVMGAGGVINGKFYVAGGVGTNGQVTNQLHVYDPVTNTWSAKAPMPSAQSGSAGAVISGKLFILGGFDASRTVLAYDPVRNIWLTKAPMPTGRRFLAAARYTLNGSSRILAIGGIGTEASPRANESYQP